MKKSTLTTIMGSILLSTLLLTASPAMARTPHKRHTKKRIKHYAAHHKAHHATHHTLPHKVASPLNNATPTTTVLKNSTDANSVVEKKQPVEIIKSTTTHSISPVSKKIAELKISSQENTINNKTISQEISTLSETAPKLNPKVLRLALTAYTNAHKKGIDEKQILTIVDYSKADTTKRLWIFNLKDNTLLINTLVAHGKNSGDIKATKFSNKPKSKASSLGLFLTENTYTGHHGYSLRLKGLTKGFNDKAEARAVVMHSAWYVSEKFVEANHRLGRSWGCFALSKTIASQVISIVKNGTLIFAYANNANWLESSPFLQ